MDSQDSTQKSTTSSYAESSNVTRNDRFNLALLAIVVMMVLGFGLLTQRRTSTERWVYESREAGIEAVYPAAWLVDEEGQYVARIRNPRATPFKTQYVIRTVPAAGQTSVRNVLDGLTLQRSSELSAYRVISVNEVTTGGREATEMRFSFVDADPNPFVERLPVVVLGLDIVLLDGDRAIIITYMADETTFDAEYDAFEQFYASLQY